MHSFTMRSFVAPSFVPCGLRRALIATLFVGLAVLHSGCRSSRATAEPAETYDTPIQAQTSNTVPAWLTEPLSWEKLRHIETWLASEGYASTPEWRIEAELQLNAGRLEFARRDVGGAKDKPAQDKILTRVRSAKLGFSRVLGEIDATGAQRKRAQDGLARADKLLGGLSPVMNASFSVVPRSVWGAAPAVVSRMDKTRGAYTRITVHHSAMPEPVPFDGSIRAGGAAALQIQRAHMNGRAYGDLGYHFLIDPAGHVLEGRDLTYQGAHALGDNNIQNIGVCLIGNFDDERPSRAALDSLRRVVEHLRGKYGIARTRIYNHRELKGTECPGTYLAPWVIAYRKEGAPKTPATKPQATKLR